MNETMIIHRQQVQAILHGLDQLLVEIGKSAPAMSLPSIQRTSLAMKAINAIMDQILEQNGVPELV